VHMAIHGFLNDIAAWRLKHKRQQLSIQ